MEKKSRSTQSKQLTNRRSLPKHEDDIPTTQGMLYLVRDQVDHKMNAVKLELKSDIATVRSDIAAVQSDIATVKSDISRLAILVEEQNSRNKVVLDGLTSLFHRQDRVESKVQKLEDLVVKTKISV